MPDFERSNDAGQLARRGHLRRVVIDDGGVQFGTLEDRQRKTLEHARLSRGYAADISPHAHDQDTFRLINQRRALDDLPGAEYVVPKLDDWKHWTKMNDWDSRNGLLETLTTKLRRREATKAEIELLVTLCRPAWAGVRSSLRRSGAVDLDAGANGQRLREEAQRVNELDRAELDHVVQYALLTALSNCPRPFPRRFFPWLRETLALRALDHVRGALPQNTEMLPEDREVQDVLDAALVNGAHRLASFATPAAPAHDQWIRTLDLSSIFDLADEYSPYARTRTACERAVDRLAPRQRAVIEAHYFRALPQTEIAQMHGLADSTVRNTHATALQKLRRDDQLFRTLETIGRVRDRQRCLQLEQQRRAA